MMPQCSWKRCKNTGEHKVDPHVKAFVGIVSDTGETVPAHHGGYLVIDKNRNLFVFDTASFRTNFMEKKHDVNAQAPIN